MKKITALIFALTMLLSLCACSDQTRGRDDTSSGMEMASQTVNESQNMEAREVFSVAPAVEAKAPEPSKEAQPPAVISDVPDSVSESVPTSGLASEQTPDTIPANPPASTPTPKPVAPATSVPTSKPDIEPESAEVSPPELESEPIPVSNPKEIAQGLIGHSVSELYAAIGQPISADYAPGCLEPDSEDGELVYSGFIVYTVRTATREYVYDVL